MGPDGPSPLSIVLTRTLHISRRANFDLLIDAPSANLPYEGCRFKGVRCRCESFFCFNRGADRFIEINRISDCFPTIVAISLRSSFCLLLASWRTSEGYSLPRRSWVVQVCVVAIAAGKHDNVRTSDSSDIRQIPGDLASIVALTGFGQPQIESGADKRQSKRAVDTSKLLIRAVLPHRGIPLLRSLATISVQSCPQSGDE
jgi:hypothetical protein